MSPQDRMRDYLNNAAPESLTKLAALDPEERQKTLESCDRLFARLKDARDNLTTEDYRDLLQWVITYLQVQNLEVRQ